MRYGPRALLVLLLVGLAGGAFAHHVEHELGEARAVVVTVRYAGGAAMAHESYELLPPGGGNAFQTGYTDALGRVSFLPPEPGDWRLRIFSEDGHGLDEIIPVTLDADEPGAEAEGGGVNVSILGLLVILGAGALFVILRERMK